MADTYDILTPAEGKNAINVEVSDIEVDSELAGVITAVSERIVDLCGPVVNKAFTNEAYNGGLEEIVLRNAAIGDKATTTISAAAEYTAAGVATTLTAENYNTKPTNGYLIEPETGIVYRRRNGYGYCFWPGTRNVVFTYTSGRAASTAAVPAKFKTAGLIMVAHLWRQRGPQAGAYRTDADGGPMFGVAPFSVPRAVTDLLAREIRPDRKLGIG